MRDVIGVILGGGQGARLFPLTQYRSKPAVPIGGKYRLIDIPISNCIHSDVNKISVLTQFNSASLHSHITRTYRFDSFSDGYVEILAAEQTMEDANWYQGTADAVRRQLHRLLSRQAKQVLILSGDHLYRMDYHAFVEEHREREADVSIAVKPVTRQQAPEFGILKVDKSGRIVAFSEKPKTDAELDDLKLEATAIGGFGSSANGFSPGEEFYLASMGIYVFEPPVLTSLLMASSREDFGKHIIPDAIEKIGVYAHTFAGYWEDIGTIRSFYEANLALTDPDPDFAFYEASAPVYTHQRHLAGSLIEKCHIDRAIITEGCRIQQADIQRSVVGHRTVIGSGVKIVDTVLMGADFYETVADRERNTTTATPDLGIGNGTVISQAIIDKNARIGERVLISNEEGVAEAEGEGYYIRDRIVVIPKNAVIANDTRI